MATAFLAAIALLSCSKTDSGPSHFSGSQLFGEAGRQPGQFSRPRAVAFTKSGLVVAVDRTGRLQLFDAANWEFVRQWRFPDYNNGTPTGVTVDSNDDTIWVADTHYSRILHYDQQGNLLTRFGEAGENPGQMIFPTDVCPDPDGKTLWISEYGRRNRILKFTRDGQFIAEWGSQLYEAEELGRPMAICLSGDAALLYVIDAGNNRVAVYDREGKLQRKFGSDGAEPGQLKYPLDMAIAPDGTLFIAEYGNSRISHFSTSGEFLGVWGEPGHAAGQLFLPWGCAVSDRGELLIADTNNQRLQLLVKPDDYFRKDAPATSSAFPAAPDSMR